MSVLGDIGALLAVLGGIVLVCLALGAALLVACAVIYLVVLSLTPKGRAKLRERTQR